VCIKKSKERLDLKPTRIATNHRGQKLKHTVCPDRNQPAGVQYQNTRNDRGSGIEILGENIRGLLCRTQVCRGEKNRRKKQGQSMRKARDAAGKVCKLFWGLCVTRPGVAKKKQAKTHQRGNEEKTTVYRWERRANGGGFKDYQTVKTRIELKKWDGKHSIATRCETGPQVKKGQRNKGKNHVH